nr:MAG TPA: xylan esterase [Caudoviricetes sp.]
MVRKTVEEAIKKLRAAWTGREVRDRMADTIEAMNEEVTNTSSKQSILEETFNNLIINEGNSNAEVVAARVDQNGNSYDTLGKRMNNFDEQLDNNMNLINNKVSLERFNALKIDVNNVLDVLKYHLGVYDLNYDIEKYNYYLNGCNYRDFTREKDLTFDNLINLNNSGELNKFGLKVSTKFETAGILFQKTFTSGSFLVKTGSSKTFCISLFQDENSKLMFWCDGSNKLQYGKYTTNLQTLGSSVITPIDGATIKFKINNNNLVVYYNNAEAINIADISSYVNNKNYIGFTNVGTPWYANEIKEGNIDFDFNSVDYRNVVDYIGRWYDKESGKYTYKNTINAGAGFNFNINSATKFNIYFQDQALADNTKLPIIAVRFNGGEWSRYQVNALKNYSIEVPTPPGSNFVECVCGSMSYTDNKWIDGKGVCITKITTNGVITSNYDNRNEILIFGDSITEGQLINGTNNMLDQRAELSYSYKLSEKLGMRANIVGFGGTGLLIGGNAGMQEAKQMITRITSTVNANDDKSKIKLIVVNYGTNDYYNTNNETNFKNALITYINLLKSNYPTAKILIVQPVNIKCYPNAFNEVLSSMPEIYTYKTDKQYSTTDRIHLNKIGSENLANDLYSFIKLNNII